MNKILCLLLFFILSLGLYSQDIFELYEDISDFRKKIEMDKSLQLKEISNKSAWIDQKYFTLGYDPTYQKSASLLYYQFGKGPMTFFGIVQKEDNSLVFYYDFMGENQLVGKSNKLLAPYDAYDNTEMPRDNKVHFLPIYSMFIDTFQDDGGPQGTGSEIISAMEEISLIGLDITIPNRDLVYAFYYYTQMAIQFPMEGVGAMQYLIEAYGERFKAYHPLFLLFMTESCINGGIAEYAQYYNSQLLKAVPDFIPALVYDMKLEADKKLKAQKLKALKQEHPNHWIVKQL